jgi:hypothetical protein
MKKLFKFEERIPATLIQYYEVEAETEEEALRMVQNGYGYQDSVTQEDLNAGSEFELYDTEDLP